MTLRVIRFILLVATILHHATASDTFPLEKPDFRYTPWQDLDSDAQIVAETKLGFTPVTWNVPGLADVEQLGWWELTPDQEEGATELGFAEDVWDCFIHHYDSYSWGELESYNHSDHFRVLGWNRSAWEGESSMPQSEEKWWGQLTDEERSAANAICYFEDNWDGIDMNPNNGEFPYPKPDFRFVPWSELSSDIKDTAQTALGYDESTWDYLGTNIAERNVFNNLDSGQREGALEIGFYTHTWDCFMNHYNAYFWSSLYGDIKTAYETLGWTEDSWSEVEGSSPPDTQYTLWKDLTPEEKAAATDLCYFEETWNGSRSIKPDAASSAHSTLATSTVLAFALFIGTHLLL